MIGTDNYIFGVFVGARFFLGPLKLAVTHKDTETLDTGEALRSNMYISQVFSCP